MLEGKLNIFVVCYSRKLKFDLFKGYLLERACGYLLNYAVAEVT